MKKTLLIVLILVFNSFNCFAKKLDVEIKIEVLIDGITPLSGGYINIVNQVPNPTGMLKVENLGIRVLDINGRSFLKLNGIDRKGLLNITVLKDKCDWHSDFVNIRLIEVASNIKKVTLKPKSEKCN